MSVFYCLSLGPQLQFYADLVALCKELVMTHLSKLIVITAIYRFSFIDQTIIFPKREEEMTLSSSTRSEESHIFKWCMLC